jgi:tripartite-type tricarboxylate transporter receptor subunit TctC
MKRLSAGVAAPDPYVRVMVHAFLRWVKRVAISPLHWLLFGLAFGAGAALAQGYPDKGRPIKIIVPTGPGSAIDLLARAYGKAMTDVAGVNVFVDNKAGAEGVIGMQAFLASPADGYTMLVVSSSLVALNPVMIPNLPYDPLKDLVPLAAISKAGLVMNLGASTPFRSAREFIAAARANPGKYTCASSTTTLRMACEFLQASAKIKLLIVPYKTTAAAMMALASGEADVLFVDAGSSIAQWKTGRVRGVTVTTPERLPSLPQLPTTREEGVPDFLMSAWYAAYFPKGTPAAVVTKMQDILRNVATRPEVGNVLATFVHEPLGLVGEEVTSMNRREIAGWSKLVRDHNINLAN